MNMQWMFGSVLLAFGLQAGAGGTEVLVAKVDGVIGPITAKFMIEAIDLSLIHISEPTRPY